MHGRCDRDFLSRQRHHQMGLKLFSQGTQHVFRVGYFRRVVIGIVGFSWTYVNLKLSHVIITGRVKAYVSQSPDLWVDDAECVSCRDASCAACRRRAVYSKVHMRCRPSRSWRCVARWSSSASHNSCTPNQPVAPYPHLPKKDSKTISFPSNLKL